VAPRFRHNLCHAVHSSRTILDKRNGGSSKIPQYGHLYFLFHLRQIFLAADSQKFFSFQHRTHVISLSRMTHMSLLFGFCAAAGMMHAVPDGVVGSHTCRCHPFAACTNDATLDFNHQIVSALTWSLSRSTVTAQLTFC